MESLNIPTTRIWDPAEGCPNIPPPEYQRIFDLRMRASRKMVLVMLQHHIDGGETELPTGQTLAAETGLSVRTVRRCLAEFRKDGFIQ